MADFDWYRIQFLESAGNLSSLIEARTGRAPSDAISREIAACVQQGRQFYQSAQNAPLEIKPLLLYYGMVAFAKSLILARRGQGLATLKQSHGLSDTSQSRSALTALTVRIDGDGTFQAFNDAIRDFHRLGYTDANYVPRSILFSSAESVVLRDVHLSLKDILARIPYLEVLYFDTFSEHAATVPLAVEYRGQDQNGSDECTIRVTDRTLFTDLQSLIEMVTQWRGRYPFLKRWRFVEAEHFWGQSNLKFENSVHSAPELAAQFMVSVDRYRAPLSNEYFPFVASIPPLLNGFNGGGSFVAMPVGEHYISDYSMHLLGLFLLGSLVRYRPSTWRHAVSRTALSQAPADDRALALVERFLNINSEIIPPFVATALNPSEDQFPGSPLLRRARSS